MSSDPSDEELMLDFQQRGDYAAFEKLFSRNKTRAYRFFSSLAGNPAVAEDVSQHVWLKVIELAEAGRYKAGPPGSFLKFLLKLGRNHFIDEYRRKHESSRVGPLDSAPEPTDVSASNAATRAIGLDEQRALVDGALRNIPGDQREVLVMWSAGMSAKSIADVVGAPVDTVLSRKKYGLKKLRELMGGVMAEELFDE